MRTILREVSPPNNSDVYYTEIVETYHHKLRVSIRSNSYDFQCSASIGRYDGVNWQPVHSLVPSQMKTPKALYVRHGVGFDEFEADRNELFRVARQLLDIPDPDA